VLFFPLYLSHYSCMPVSRRRSCSNIQIMRTRTVMLCKEYPSGLIDLYAGTTKLDTFTLIFCRLKEGE
jgi:hypothetical protein